MMHDRNGKSGTNPRAEREGRYASITWSGCARRRGSDMRLRDDMLASIRIRRCG